MEIRKLSVAAAYVLSGYQVAANATEVPDNLPPGITGTGHGSAGIATGAQPISTASTQPGSSMRALTAKEVELIMGANAFTSPPTLSGTHVTATTHPGTQDPGGVTTSPGDGSGNGGGGTGGTGSGDGNGGSGGSSGSGGGGGTSPNPQNCYTPMAAQDRVDANTIFANEQGIHTTGYMLDPKSFPNAGVTIGAGVDLGQQSAAGLKAMGVAQSIINTVSPYLSPLHGSNASAYVAAHGEPTLSLADATSLSTALMESTRATVASGYNSATNGEQFDQLPEAAQTVIVDAAYPNGPHLASSAPSFWGDVTTGNWSAAVNELQNWYGPGDSMPRYVSDATLLQSAVSSNSLPVDATNGQCH